MLQSTFEEARAHLQIVLGIDIQTRLDVQSPWQFKTYALVGTLVLVYRYAETLGQHITIFDMTTTGHESHQYGMDLDFDYAPDTFNPVNQANIISDMLRVWRAMDSEVNAFRLGFYFDRFDNADAQTNVRTFEDFQRVYGRTAREYRQRQDRRLSSMHLGLRYKFESTDYKGDKKLPEGFWGRGKKSFGFDGLWKRRIRSWDIGFIRERASLVAAAALRDLETLDRNPPTMVVLGAGAIGAGPVR